YHLTSAYHHPHLHSFPTRRSSDLPARRPAGQTGRDIEPPLSRRHRSAVAKQAVLLERQRTPVHGPARAVRQGHRGSGGVCEPDRDRKSTRLNSSHLVISYAVFCLK